ncbi:MAG TPA: zinc-binding dehydrogenase, partial [Acidimicrobiales bacterium]
AGGVGGLLVQLASEAGAVVVALAGDARKLEHARSLGAKHAVNYRTPDWPHVLDELANGLDVVFDSIGGDVTAALVDRIVPGARYVQFGMASGVEGVVDPTLLEARGAGLVPLHAVANDPARLYDLVEEALRRAVERRLRPVIGQTWPLEHARDAHAAIEARSTIGKTLLLVSS